MAIKRTKVETPDGASYRMKRRLNMPPSHDQFDAIWGSLAAMQMNGLEIPKGTVLKTTQGDIELTESLRIEFDLPKPMDYMMGKINAVRRHYPKKDKKAKKVKVDIEVKKVKKIEKFVDKVTGKSYKTERSLKAAITRRKNKAKKS